MKANDLFKAATDEARTNIDYAKQRAANLRKRRAELMPILKMLAPLLSSETDYVYISAGTYTTSVNVTMRKLDGFKDDRLSQVLYVVMFLKGVEMSETTDYPESLNRDYHFKVGEDITITIGAYVKNDSPTCRKVKVGEEMKLVAQYKIECD